jgi:transcriptional regulator with GAF, ATPase, and Fis domain
MDAELIGVSQNIQGIRELTDRVAESEITTLVCGETGVGKDLVVQNLYQKSKRFGKPFVKVNCAALPDTLLESEMFGYEQGAFTGAQNKMRGKFEQTNGGVLFLDEIGDMSLSLQSKLLHALQDGSFTPLGSERPVKSDSWVIVATNHNLRDDLRKGRFRIDLYHRVNTIEIRIEPLRNRPEDVPYLIDYYIKDYSKRFNGQNQLKVSKKNLDKMISYHWPGNVRELQNVLKRIMILGEDEWDFDNMVSKIDNDSHDKEDQSSTADSLIPDNLLKLNGYNAAHLKNLSLKEINKKVLAQVEKEVISYVLEKTRWNRRKASQRLKISYKALLYKIKGLNIEPKNDLDDFGF